MAVKDRAIMALNLLVIGNGFDLAHGLPTRYSDFLDFLTLCLKEWHNWRNRNVWPGDPNPYKDDAGVLEDLVQDITDNKMVVEIFNENKSDIEQILKTGGKLSFSYENTWARYFLYIYAYKKSFSKEFKWIDIEEEMLNFISHIQSQSYCTSSALHLSMSLPYRRQDNFTSIQFDARNINRKIKEIDPPQELLKRKIFECLFQELEQFAELLRFYLSVVMQQFNKHTKSVYRINSSGHDSIIIDQVISFNYTHTAELCYTGIEDVHYINGNGQNDNEKIILGIENPSIDKTDDYCKDNVNLFFKNVQRILYDYDYTYNEWLHKYAETRTSRMINDGETGDGVNVHIIGHSLAISDKYILTDVIMGANTVCIYYYNEQDKQNKITNLYRLLGDEDFSKHVNHYKAKPSIKFINQRNIMISDATI